MAYAFGADIKYKFYPLKEQSVNDETFEVALLGTPTIYIFTDKPSRTVAAAGTGAAQTISSWSNLPDGKGKEFTITAIDDPDPTGAKDYYSYYIAINFTLQDSEQTQTIIKLLPLRRVVAHTESAYPDIGDLDSVHPDISDFFSEHELENAIKAAFRNARLSLKSKGFDWAAIWNPDELKTHITFEALSLLTLSQITSGSQGWEAKYTHYSKQAEQTLAAIQLIVDENLDGVPEAEVQEAVTSIKLIR